LKPSGYDNPKVKLLVRTNRLLKEKSAAQTALLEVMPLSGLKSNSFIMTAAQQ
jgi:hypothetical protein